MPGLSAPLVVQIRRWLLPLALLAALTGWMFWLAGPRPDPAPKTATLASLMPALERGEPAALKQARQIVQVGHADVRADLAVMLAHSSWQLRAAACQLLAGLPADQSVPALVPRASDDSWQVRAAAFEVLLKHYPVAPPPTRDLPMAQRELTLLQILDSHDRQHHSALRSELCELYAEDQHVEFAEPLVRQCLTCHVGAAAADHPPSVSASACVECHQSIVSQWSGSAHAQSLTHLHLRTVNSISRQPENYDFGSLRGIDCMDCHQLAAVRSSQPAGRCRYSFLPGSAANSCATCHASTATEWRAWLAGPQPRVAIWPPGQLELDHRGDMRACADCHMPPSSDLAGAPEHRWQARRDLAFLRSGVNVELVSPPRGGSRTSTNEGASRTSDKNRPRLELTNLAGHGYPTGTRRRSLALSIQVGSSSQPLAQLIPPRPGVFDGRTHSALAPGEQRAFEVAPLPDSAITWNLTYFRYRSDPNAPSWTVASGTWQP